MGDVDHLRHGNEGNGNSKLVQWWNIDENLGV
jgi:hypothetical protein